MEEDEAIGEGLMVETGGTEEDAVEHLGIALDMAVDREV